MDKKELLEGWSRESKPWFDEFTIKMLCHFIDTQNEVYHKKQLKLCGVSVMLPNDPMVLAEYLHDKYEEIAKKEDWNTQENCKVSFKDLPTKNKTTMILLAGKLILDFGGN